MQGAPHSSVVELLGVYALDAVDEAERNLIEHHLEECSQCRAEVRDHHEVAALLAADPVQPPARVWDGIVAQLDAQRPAAQQATVIPLQRRRPSVLTSTRWVTSVAAAVLVALTAGVVTQSQRIGDLNSRVSDQDQQISILTAGLAVDPLQQAVTAALADPAAQVANLTADGSSATMSIVVLPDGTGYVYQSNLEALPSNATYQLWAVVDDKVISAGVLGNQPALVPFHVDPQGLQGLVITQEVAGGVPQSEADPVVAWFKA
jgi:hypothetical protein